MFCEICPVMRRGKQIKIKQQSHRLWISFSFFFFAVRGWGAFLAMENSNITSLQEPNCVAFGKHFVSAKAFSRQRRLISKQQKPIQFI